MYLEAWLPKLASWHRRLIFIDGFAGPGRYSKGEPGSPIVALQAAINHKHDLTRCELQFLFVEQDGDRFSHLEATIRELETPEHVRVDAVHADFVDIMAVLMERLEGHELAPALVMVDPFGPKGASYEVIKRLAAYQRSEFLISFMYEPIARFIGHDAFEKHLDDLFGCSTWREGQTLTAAARERFLIELYVGQIRAAGLPWVRTFEMRDAGNRTEYFLVFATHHPAGLDAMKQAMWRVDPTGQFQFSDFTNPNQPTLFAIEPDYAQLRSLLLARFAGTTTTIDAIERWIVEDTSFLRSHIRKRVLVSLEEAGTIVIETPRKKARTYPTGTVIRFT